MDPVTSQSAVAAGVTSIQADGPSPESSNGVISSDFETFLKMLTAQIENQDPLNPMDNTEYATQLATFSSVEQQVLTNDLLKAMQAPAPGLASVSEWIGMEAKVTGEIALTGDPVELNYAKPADSQHDVLVVTSSTGREVAKIDVTGISGPVSWAGTDQNGVALPNGAYKVSLESLDAGANKVTSDVETYVPVSEARMGSNGPEVRLATGTVLASDEVTALRAPL